MNKIIKTQLKVLLVFIVGFLLFLLFTSCKSNPSPVYVPVESTDKQTDDSKRNVKDSIRIINVINTKDSINIRDSIVFKVNDRGEIVSKEVYRWKERYRENNYLLNILQTKYDSLLQVKQTVIERKVPYPVKGDTVYINKLNWYQEASVWFTSLVLVALALYLGIKYRGKIFSFFRKIIFKI